MNLFSCILYAGDGDVLQKFGGYEDIAMLDARTGKLLMENTSASGENKFISGLTKKQSAELAGMNTAFEIIHNHPGSTWPSWADVKGLFNRELAYASSVIGHDGSIYRMVSHTLGMQCISRRSNHLNSMIPRSFIRLRVIFYLYSNWWSCRLKR